jgi:RHS repeat-associated protein
MQVRNAYFESTCSSTISVADYYYRARYYDPSAGRFINEDPIRFKAGINFYRYVGNSPVDWIDPTGLFAELICEPIASMRAGWKFAIVLKLGWAHHCFIHVKCKDYDVTIELEGPQEDPQHGKPHMGSFNPDRRGIRRPITFPSGYKCCQNEDSKRGLNARRFPKVKFKSSCLSRTSRTEQQHFRFPDY